jgi:phospholipase/carboxylesterase
VSDTGFVHRWVPGDTGLTVLALHGTGANEDDLLPLVRHVAPGANVLSPRGKVSEMGAPRFFRRLAEGVFDVEDLIARTHELADFVVASAAGYSFDPARVVALGYSNGANIAGSVLFLRPEVLVGAALVRPMAPFRPGELPGGDAPRLDGKRILVSAGERDPLIPGPSTDSLVAQLSAAGAEVDDRRQRAGHELVQGDLDALAEWFAGW